MQGVQKAFLRAYSELLGDTRKNLKGFFNVLLGYFRNEPVINGWLEAGDRLTGQLSDVPSQVSAAQRL